LADGIALRGGFGGSDRAMKRRSDAGKTVTLTFVLFVKGEGNAGCGSSQTAAASGGAALQIGDGRKNVI